MSSKRDYDEYDDEYDDDEDYYDDEYDDDVPVKKKKGRSFLIGLGIFILIVALIYGWVRYRATLVMDNYPLYTVNQDHDMLFSGKGSADSIQMIYDDSIEGFVKGSHISKYGYVETSTGKIYTETEYIEYIKFDKTENAQKYLRSQTYDEKRYKHIINNYYFDEPSDEEYGWQHSMGVLLYGITTFAHSESLEG